MTQLEKDMAELADEVVTKKDIIAAFKIMGEVTGGIAVFSVAIAALTVWLPGIGLPISTGVAVKSIGEIIKWYPNLPTEERRTVAKCAKWLYGIVH